MNETFIDAGQPAAYRRPPARPTLRRSRAAALVASPFAVEVIATVAGLEGLERDWRELFDRTPHRSGAQTWDYAMAAWRLVEAERSRLHVVTVRQDGRLAALWPLRVRQEAGVRVASHLGRGSDEEYAGPLIATGPGAGEAARRSLAGVRGGADVLRVFNVHPDHAIGPVLGRAGFGFRAPTPVRIAETSAHRDMAGWLASRSKNFRAKFHQAHRRLEAMGEVQARRVGDVADIPEFVDWMVGRKLAQLDGRGVARSWLRAPSSRRLLAASLVEGPASSRAHGFEVTVGGRRAAAGFALEGERLELSITVYDPAFAAASPGTVLHAFMAETAIARGQDLDFRFGDERYKDSWANRVETRWNYELALTPIGLARVGADWSSGVARAVRRRLGPTLRRLRRR